MKREEIIQAAERLEADFARLTMEPGIYTITYDPSTEEVYTTATVSGDNSYIPGDDRIVLIRYDGEESISNLDAGLDQDGDLIEHQEEFSNQILEALEEAGITE